LKHGSKKDPFKHNSWGKFHLDIKSSNIASLQFFASLVFNEVNSFSNLYFKLHIHEYVKLIVGYFIPLKRRVAASKGLKSSIISLITFHS